MAVNLDKDVHIIHWIKRVLRGSEVRCLTRNPGAWVQASLDPLGFFVGVSLGKTLQSLA